MIPVSIVTGFLGSGKTTLISRVLRDLAFAQTAVIVNEFGDVSLDHDLIASSNDSILTLNTGCLCCAVQTDLGRTLTELHERRQAGVVKYDRVLIETSGLSDPAPILQSMMTDPAIWSTHQMPYVVTVVDCVHGVSTLGEHSEAQHQVALADTLLISKTDLQPIPAQLTEALDALNLDAARIATLDAGPGVLFGSSSVACRTERLDRLPVRARHSGINTFTVIRSRPLPAVVMTLLLEAIADHCGTRLLRLKGIVAVEEMPGRPMVIHGVRHVVSAPVFLDRWPSEDERTRIVFITRSVPQHFASRLLDVIEAEVRDELEASHALNMAR